MLLKKLRLENYAGIYNGLGLYQIEIDFTKCQHRIILIKGDNGTGKSTIEKSLKPLPDDNSSFINGRNGIKEIEYIDETSGVIYSIRFIHECKNNGRTTKGYITKVINNTPIEMNPSGNISSCKDIIYEELQLDPNYITLTQLSSGKRGIADLKPSDRKRYVNSILTSTDVYNDMYKKLSKKASTYRGMMNSITSKLDTIGNIERLTQNINSIESNISEAENLIEQYSEIINKEKGMLYSLDPDNKIRKRIDYLDTAIKDYNAKRSEKDRLLRKIYTNHPDVVTMEITSAMLDKIYANMLDIATKITSLKSKVSVLLQTKQNDADELQAKTIKLQSINSGKSLSEVKQIKNNLSNRKKEIENRWNRVLSDLTLSSEEFVSIYETIQEMSEIMINIEIIKSSDINIEYNTVLNQIQYIDNQIEEFINERNKLISAEDKLSILEQRPKNCTNDYCPFIADALKAKSIIDNSKKFSRSLKEMNSEKDTLQDRLSVIEANRQLYNTYKANSRLFKELAKLGLASYDECMHTLKYNYSNTIFILKGLLEYINDLTEYKVIYQNLIDIESKYHSLSSQEDFINMITSDIERLQKQIDIDFQTIQNMNFQISNLQNQYTHLETSLDLFKEVFEYRMSINEYDEAIKILNEEISNNKANIDKIQKINSDIDKLTKAIAELKEKLKPLKKDKDTLEYRLNISNEYNKELEEYKLLFNKIDTLRYYCAPTTGIQLLFANIYLSKIIDNANKILSNLFGGIFMLLPLIITETEFRIPVAVNGGINHDDITSMSSAQISLISMIISIALLSQTSTKLNIIVGDEIDAPFDAENRREFISILYQLMSLVKASQCVLISHNSEIPMNECDIILLRCDNDVVSEGNIIWSYK